MWGRFGRKQIFSGANVALLVLGGLIILTLMTRRHEPVEAIRAAYRTVRERFGGGGQEQPSREDTNGSSEEHDEVLVQEEDGEEETEGRTIEVEESSSQEIRNIIRESVGRSEEGNGRKAESQSGESTAAPEGSRKEAEGTEGPPIEGYDSLGVGEITQKLLDWSVEEVEQLRDYEARNRNRPSIMQRFERRLNAARENLKKRGNGEAEESSGKEMRRIIRESVKRSTRER